MTKAETRSRQERSPARPPKPREEETSGGVEHDGIVRRSIDVTVRGIDKEARSVRVVASTDTIDSHGDIVEQTFDLKRFKKNPVVLFNHNRFSDSWLGGTVAPTHLLPIGRAEASKVVDGQLEATLVFGSKDYNELSEQIFLGFSEDMIRAVSIGFRPGKITEEIVDGKTRFRLAKNELFEISVVPIGSNPDAVAKSVDADHKHFRQRAAAEHQDADEGAHKEKDPMDPKDLQAKLDKMTGDLAVAQKASEDATARANKAEAELAATKASLATAQENVGRLEKQVTEFDKKSAESDVDALVGKKIAPTSKTAFLALRMADKARFEEVTAAMPELPALKDIVPSDPKTRSTAGEGGATDTKSVQSLVDEVAQEAAAG